MTYKLKNIIYLVLVYSVISINVAEAKKKGPWKVLCGNGETAIAYDKLQGSASKACIKAGHPPPRVNVKPATQMGLHSSQQGANADAEWDPNSARLPKGGKKLKSNCEYDKNSAVLPTGPCKKKKPASLLLPAVQAATSASCGSSSSVSRALDQCGKKGHKFAACKKKGGNWTCSPTAKNDRNSKPTGIANRR